MHCFYSNRVEMLYERLVQNLFSGASSRPFAKRLVLVASPAMRSWVQQRMVQDERLAVFAGITIEIADHAFENWGKGTLGKSIPSKNTLTLAVELALSEFAQLGRDDLPLMARGDEKQTRFFAAQVTELFCRYGKYGSRLLDYWKTAFEKSWQSILWKNVYETLNWTTPVEAIAQVQSIPYDSIHLFSVSFLPQSYLECLDRLSSTTTTFGYILSPCRAFWCDILGDKQQSYYLHSVQNQGVSIGQQMALEELLVDTNPLLANFGRLGREMAAQLERLDDHPEQEYVIPSAALSMDVYAELVDEHIFSEKISSLSLLQAVQTDLTLLRSYREEPILLEEVKPSIQIHAVPSRWREIEVLYNLLVDEIISSQTLQEPIKPNDIIVMAPDIALYLPYIKAVFEGKGSCLPIQVMDVRMPSSNTYIQAFLGLLDLAKSAWENRKVLDLLEFIPFLKRQGWSQEEAVTLKKWTRQSAVHWGFDVQHRDDFLVSSYFTEATMDRAENGTWVNSLKRLCDSLLTNSTDNPVFLEVSEAVLLGEWWQFLYGLKAKLEPLSAREERTTEEWIAYLQDVADAYLYWEYDDEAIQGRSVLIQALKELGLPFSKKVSFNTVESCLLNTLDQATATYREGNLQAVRFCSMLPMRAVPAKVIVLIGMEADIYPKKGYEPIGLDEIKATGLGDYCPRQTDFDRYLFLESLLSARSRFIMTFPGQWDKKGHSAEKLPSPLLEELISYLDHAYRINGELPSKRMIYQHPLLSYHHSYFKGRANRNVLPSRWNWARAAYLDPQSNKRGFFGNFSAYTKLESPSTLSVDIGALKSLASNPLREFFKSVLKADIERTVLSPILEEPLDLTALNHGLMSSKALSRDMSVLIHEATMKGEMPFRPIKDIHTAQLHADAVRLNKLSSVVIDDPQNLVTFHLSSHFQAEEISGTTYCFPPLIIPRPHGGYWALEGEIPMISPRGMLVYGENKWEKMAKAWPQYLIFHYLVQQHRLSIEPALVPVHRKMEQTAIVEVVLPNVLGTLVRFLEYYDATRSNPSPLIPDWLPLILEGDEEKLQKEFEKNPDTKFSFCDETALWLFADRTFPDAAEVIQTWQPIAQGVFGELKSIEKNKRKGV